MNRSNPSRLAWHRAALLTLASLYSSPGLSQLPADNIFLQQVGQAAREHLARQAALAKLQEPLFEVTVAPGTRAPASCRGAITVEAQDTRLPNRMRFGALCADGWRQEFVVRASISAKVAVTREPVAAGQLLGLQNMTLERRDITQVSDSGSDLAALAGMASRRTLRAGELLRRGQLSAPQLVKRGAPVRIVARREQVEVSMAGEALDDGAQDALIRVRNATSGSVIRARVIGPDTVRPADLAPFTQSPD
jgi:flagella basal body P-ring formation protein FlgA